MVKSENGSVLMEFIVMMPVYLILIGFCFFTGELSLHGIALTASADRSAAGAYAARGAAGEGFDEDIMTRIGWAIMPDAEKAGAERALQYDDVGKSEKATSWDLWNRSQGARIYAGESGFAGTPWSRLAVALVDDNYALTPFSRSMVMFWGHIEDHVAMTSQPDALDSDSAMGELLDKDSVGRTRMTGKDLSAGTEKARAYGFYTLQRSEAGGSSHRYWPSSGLVEEERWRGYVQLEPYFGSSAKPFPDEALQIADTPGNAPSGIPEAASPHERDKQLVSWVN